MQASNFDLREWLETDGLGGFAMGTVAGLVTRRYHGLLTVATQPPGGRVNLVNGLELWAETERGRYALSTHWYGPGVAHPDGATRIVDFKARPGPTWTYRLEDGTTLQQEILMTRGRPQTLVVWRRTAGSGKLTLEARLFLSGRDYHSTHHENPAFDFTPQTGQARVAWQPYPGLPGVSALFNGQYHHEPQWYRNFELVAEQARGLDCREDFASPGRLQFDLTAGPGMLLLSTTELAPVCDTPTGVLSLGQQIMIREREWRSRCTPLEQAAEQYIVKRGNGFSIIAGYPWFTDWGRDTFIALRGIGLATGRLDRTRAILLEWASAVSEGMLPNRFADAGDLPEFNAVDASLWFVIAVNECLTACRESGAGIPIAEMRTLTAAVREILNGYVRGTRHGIRMDADGLLAAGEPGVQLTWMDAKIGDWVVTPRIGKPVEVQALWYNALLVGAQLDRDAADEWTALATQVHTQFEIRFWNAETGCLFDVIDVDHTAGRNDGAVRPNQLFAIGGLPHALFIGERARQVVEVAVTQLLTPLGLRSLAPADRDYRGTYGGGVWERDGAYHQGTVWPWLMGPFVEAWVRVHGDDAAARREAAEKFVKPLIERAEKEWGGHLPEVASGDAPHTPGGCPFQAWSVGELLRLQRVVCAEPTTPPGEKKPAAVP